MKLIADNIILQPGEPDELIRQRISERYSIEAEFGLTILKRSLDARKRGRIVYRFRAVIDVPESVGRRLLGEKDISEYHEKPLPGPAGGLKGVEVSVIGSGPAGLFCALRLIEAGARVFLFEQGRPVEERMRDIAMLERDGALNVESNVLFGEGGAGAYSDGKLTTRTVRPETGWFYRKLVELGVPEKVLYDTRPHLGTDRLAALIREARRKILDSGSVIEYNSRLTDIDVKGGRIRGLSFSNGREHECGILVLATGHSARDVYALLHSKGISLEKKGFAVGVRIEHPADLIDEIQYGPSAFRGILPRADYILTSNNKNSGRGIYTFCMCPGGMVINASSEQDGLNVNGMSYSGRNSPYSNSALVVTISPGDIQGGPLSGLDFQRRIEEKAFEAGGGGFFAPAQKVTSFLSNGNDSALPGVSYRPGVVPARISGYLPEWIVEELCFGLRAFNRKMKGFLSEQGVLVGAETRTSSPVRIVRNSSLQSVSVEGLYPAGEGAGYAGGIVSSAVDGIRAADSIASTYGRQVKG